MKRTTLVLMGIALALLGAAFTHFHFERSARQRSAELTLQRERLEARLRQVNDLNQELSRERKILQSMTTFAEKSDQASRPVVAASVASTPSRMQRIAADPKLRELYVQAYVNQRNLAFVGLFKQLNFTADQRRKFEEIQVKYQQGLLDCARFELVNPTSLREAQRRVAAEQDAACAELFGPALDQWKNANATQGARQVVGQIIQQNLQSADPFDAPSVSRLTAVLARHRAAASAPVDSLGYDWNAIFPEARGLLNSGQWEGFQTSVKLLRTQARMNALANGK